MTMTWPQAIRGFTTMLLALACIPLACCKNELPPLRDQPASSIPKPSREPPNSLFSANTYAVMVGVLTFADPSVTPFSAEDRKDQELRDALVARGVPAGNIALLLDEAATVAGIRAQLARLTKLAPEGSTFVFYYAGHGTRGDGGSTSFLAYDTNNDPDTALSVDEITRTLQQSFRGARVILMGDCCYSGALRQTAETLRKAGKKTVSLTSAGESNASTQNWTFTQTVIDAVKGDVLFDRDRNGVITLEELGQEVSDAMKYRERQRSGYSRYDVPPALALAKANGPRPGPDIAEEPFVPGRYMEAHDGVGWQPVRVLQTRGDASIVRYYHYSEVMDVVTAHSELRPIRYRRHPKGASVRVFWGGKIWDAKILELEGDFHKITYPGWPSFWDEWVLSNRIADESEDGKVTGAVAGALAGAVQVEWRGRWYAARIMKRVGDRFLVHYDGYDSEWDEWVERRRIRRGTSATPER